MKRPPYLTEWEFFVWRHKARGNLILHFFSLTLFLVPLILCIFYPSWLWAIPIVLSAPVGSAGHYFYKDGSVRSRDFMHPNTVIFLIVIYSLILARRYDAIVQRVRGAIESNADHDLLSR